MKKWLAGLLCLALLAGCTKPLTLEVKDTMKTKDMFSAVFVQEGLVPEGYGVHFTVEKYVDGTLSTIEESFTDLTSKKQIISFRVATDTASGKIAVSFGTSDIIHRVKDEPIRDPFFSGVLIDLLKLEQGEPQPIAYWYANSLTEEQKKMFEEGAIDVDKLKQVGLLYVLIVEVIEMPE
ncbi:hypothetical protein QTL97_13615 [Sporosarcina thermotolerans]|uniref:Lipoprotein n=1 Tax=Sporosarcina thermotolerans TaxID=633404 RepID=A0AAW9A985_9BACL|nr:hypothetical protein [Sporosarcina thermotolerans]MDW0117977.1 hypothetical protein [Sporosarcina thermotolerans]WHT49055.1 hypothetical protein QNH10_05095 [Sporosarcina thermotolerans]